MSTPDPPTESGIALVHATGSTLGRGRPAGHRTRALAWTDRSGDSWAWLDIVAGVCVVHVDGSLGAAALSPLRAALDATGALAPARVVLNLEVTGPVQPVTVSLIVLTRRYLRARGVALTLVASAELRQALLDAHVHDLYDVAPSLGAAVSHGGRGAGRLILP